MVEFPADDIFDEVAGDSKSPEVALMSRIAQLGGFSPQLRNRLDDAPLTIEQFVDEFNFPMWLRPTKIFITDNLDAALRKRFTKTRIFDSWLEYQDDVPNDGRPSGIVFNWANVGRHMVFHDVNTFPTGGSGQFFYRKQPRKLFILQRLEDFIEELGDFTEW